MALQISLPQTSSPSSSWATTTPAGSPPSRSHSPHSAYRASSRSERLLRDTLRKADLRDHRPPRRRIPGDDDDRDDDDDDIIIHDDDDRRTPPPLVVDVASPSRPRQQPRSRPSPTRHRSALSLSSIPIPNNDAVLRSRLESALSRVSSVPDCTKAMPPSHTRAKSLASSPVHSSWPHSHSPDPAPPLTPPPTPPHPSIHLPTPHISASSSPSTPPSPFNARAASQICRQLPGYVSFQDVEGLGAPADADADESHADADGQDECRRWWSWPWGGRSRASTQ